MIWLELAFLSKVVHECDMDTPLKQGVHADTLLDHKNRKIFRMLEGYHRSPATKGLTPTMDYVVGKYPFFTPIAESDIPQKLSSLCHELKERKLAAMVSRLCTDTLRNIHGNPKQTFETLRRSIMSYQEEFTESYDVTLNNKYEWIVSEYTKLEEGGGVVGIEWPWPSFTEDTGGLRDGEFTVFYGRQKTMKSWSLLYTATRAYLDQDKRVLVLTWEVLPERLLWRVASIMAAIDYTDWRKGRLSEEAKEETFQKLRFIRSMERKAIEKGDRSSEFVITTTRADDGGPGGVDSVRRKIEERRPHLVAIDGIYNMSNDRKGGRSFKHDYQADVVCDLAGVCREYKLPMMASTQSNRYGEDIEDDGSRDVAFTDKINMFCDLLVKNYHRVENGEHYLYSKIRLARESELAGIKIHAKVGQFMTEVTRFSSDEEFTAALKQSKETEKDRVNGKGGGTPDIIKEAEKRRRGWSQ